MQLIITFSGTQYQFLHTKMMNMLSSKSMPFQESLKCHILQLCLKEQYAADLTVSVLY